MRSDDDSDLIAPRCHKNTDIYKSSTKIFPETYYFFCLIYHQAFLLYYGYPCSATIILHDILSYYCNLDFIYLIYFSLREEFSMVEREYSRMPKQEVNS